MAQRRMVAPRLQLSYLAPHEHTKRKNFPNSRGHLQFPQAQYRLPGVLFTVIRLNSVFRLHSEERR